MRFFAGVLLGIIITIGAAYIYDATTAGAGMWTPQVVAGQATKPMVNWNVVSSDWHLFTENVRHTWNRIATRS
jgi:hypothetical protein